MFKKIILLLGILVTSIALVSCGGNSNKKYILEITQADFYIPEKLNTKLKNIDGLPKEYKDANLTIQNLDITKMDFSNTKAGEAPVFEIPLYLDYLKKGSDDKHITLSVTFVLPSTN